MSTGEFKRLVESHVTTVCKTGGIFASGTKIYEPFLTDAEETIASYVAMTEVNRCPFDIQVEDKIVAILIIKGCNYNSLRNSLIQQQLSPNVTCAYTQTANNTV